MSTVLFNDDLRLTLPGGWAAKEEERNGKPALRIVGPCAGGPVIDSEEYECDFSLTRGNPVDSPLEELDFPKQLKEMSEKAPDTKVSFTVRLSTPSGESGSGKTLSYGGTGFDRKYLVISDSPELKSGFFTMGVLGKTAYYGLIISQKYIYLIICARSKNRESIPKYLQDIIERIDTIGSQITSEEREKLRREREEAERLEKERKAEAIREQKRREAEQKEAEERKKNEQLLYEHLARERKIASIEKNLETKKKEYEAFSKNLAMNRANREAEIEKLTNHKKNMNLLALKDRHEISEAIRELRSEVASLEAEEEAAEKEIVREQKMAGKKITLLQAVPGSSVILGKDPNYGGKPINWFIACSEKNKLHLIAEHTMSYKTYWEAAQWLPSEFSQKALRPEEKALLVSENGSFAFFPTIKDIEKTGKGYDAMPTAAVMNSIRNEIEAISYYSRLQKDNSVKRRHEDMQHYWVYTSSPGEWANIAGKGTWGGIGSAASFGVRPMIIVDLDKLI